MKSTFVLSFLLFASIFCGIINAQSRLLNKLKEKVEDKIVDEVFDSPSRKKNQSSSNAAASQNSQSNSNSSSSIKNTSGGGLDKADVMESINNANDAINANQYSACRHSLRQAIMGIELEIGQKVLDNLPSKINDMPANTNEDNVTTTGIGFVGLAIQRQYAGANQQLNTTVANNSVWISAVNAYLSNTAYASTNTQQEYKQITFQGHRGIIEYSDASGYKLSVPFGQASIIVAEGINFKSETAFMNAANQINLDSIKANLGEK